MSIADLFIPTTQDGSGDRWFPTSEELMERLPREYQNAGLRVAAAVLRCLMPGARATTEVITDKWLQANSPSLVGFSLSFIQKGLRALDKVLRDLKLEPWIERIRIHGRRIIVILGRFRGRAEKPEKGKKAKGAAEAPPSPPVVVPDPGPSPTDEPPPAPGAWREMIERQKAAIAASAASTAETPASAPAPRKPVTIKGYDPRDPKLAEVMAELEARKAHPAKE
jgi:hypothetical protein